MNGRYMALILLVVTGCITILVASLIISDLIFGTHTFLPQTIWPRRDDAIAIARSRIQIGEERDEAVSALSDAWYHADCRYSDQTGEDLFFYGPHSRDKVTIVVIHSKRVGEKVIVDFVGGLENYILFESLAGRQLYQRCVPEQLFATDRPTEIPIQR